MRTSILVVLLFLAAVFVSTNVVAEHSSTVVANGEERYVEQPNHSIALSELLDQEGHVVLPEGFSGSVDVAGYTLASGSGEAPRFVRGGVDPDDAWSQNEFAVPGCNGAILAAVVLSGELYFGGRFSVCGSIAAENIVRYDPVESTFFALGSGVDNDVTSLAVIGTDLYVGGRFSQAGGVAVNNIAVFDSALSGNAAWSALGSGVDDDVLDFAVMGTDLYVGGSFSQAGGSAADGIARFDTDETGDAGWSTLGDGVNGAVQSLAIIGVNLYAGGEFGQAGGAPASGIAVYDTTATGNAGWSALGSGVSDDAEVMTVISTDLYVGGDFSTAGGVAAGGIARYDTTQVGDAGWSALGSGVNGDVDALAVIGTDLFVGGFFSQAGGGPADSIARFDTTATDDAGWSALGSGAGNVVTALAVIGAELYVGGGFTQAGGIAVSRVAVFDSSATGDDGWSALSGGLNNSVSVLAVMGTKLYVGGGFTRAGGIEANRIAVFDTTATGDAGWTSLGSGVNGVVRALAVIGTDLYVGGFFSQAGGSAASNVAVYDTTATGDAGWSNLGSGAVGNTGVLAMAVIGTDLYVAGPFTQAGGNVARRVAVYDTTLTGDAAWSALGDGLSNNSAAALAVMGTDLYVGGSFDGAGGNPASRIAVYDTTQSGDAGWSALGSGVIGSVRALAVIGTDLYVGGVLSQAGTGPVSNIAVYDSTLAGDTGWSALGSGVNISVVALQAVGNNLYVGGGFTQAGGSAASRIALYDSTQAGDAGWSALGSGADDDVRAFAVGTELYVGGVFTSAGGFVNHQFARYRTFSVSGMVSGLAPGSSVELTNTGSDILMIGANGPFTFATPLEDGADYSVTVATQPSVPSQTCTVSNGSGTIMGADVTNVQITCVTDQFTVGGTVSGLNGSGLVLQNNGGDDLTITGNEPFTFTTPLDDGTAYNVTVLVQPTDPSQTCTVKNGSGTLAGADVTNVEVTCSVDQFTVGGTVSGLDGDGLLLQNNDGDDLPIDENGSFTFATALNNDAAYDVSVAVQPDDLSQTCTVSNSSGTINEADVTDIQVTCVTNQFTVGGTVAGLSGAGLVLQNNGGDNLIIALNGAFAFPTALDDGLLYTVTVLSQPVDQDCSLNNSIGIINGRDVTSVSVICVASAAIDVMPEVLEFADQSLGVPSSPQMAVVESAGSGDLMIDSVNLLGIHGDDFQIIADTCADQSLPPDDFCGIEVTFTPTAGGVREAWIEIESNAQDSPSRIGLIGTNDVIFFDGFEGSEFDQ